VRTRQADAAQHPGGQDHETQCGSNALLLLLDRNGFRRQVMSRGPSWTIDAWSCSSSVVHARFSLVAALGADPTIETHDRR